MSTFRETLIAKAINEQDDILTPYLALVDRYDAAFLTKKLAPFSNKIKSTILTDAFNKPNNFERNRHVLDTTNKLYKLLPKKLAHLFFCFDDDINNIAKECANYCRQIAITPEKVNFLYYQAKNKQRNDSELERTVSHEFRSSEITDSETNSEKSAVFRSANTEISGEFADAKQKALFDFFAYSHDFDHRFSSALIA